MTTPQACIAAQTRRRADEAEAGRLQPLRERLRLRRLRVPVGRRARRARSRSGAYDQTSSCSGVPASRSSSTPRAFAIVASILPRCRTMPASPSRRCDVALAEARDRVGIEAGERAAEVLALAQDRQPREPGLEPLEAEPLVEPALVGDRPAPLLVVVRDVERVARRPAAGRLSADVDTDDAVDDPHRDTSRPAGTRAATAAAPVESSNAEPWRGQTTVHVSWSQSPSQSGPSSCEQRSSIA